MAGRHAYCCLLLMTLWISQHGVESMNLALNRPTLTSSTGSGSNASYAVDGDIAGTFYKSEATPSPNQWIRINLEQIYFIRKINVYNRPALRSRLSLAYILLFAGTSPQNPNLGTWSEVLYQGQPLRNSSTPASITYDAVTENEPLPLARYIAVYNTFENGLAISEVEVEGFTRQEYKPTLLQMTGTSASCVTLTWQPPSGGFRVSYQVRCTSNAWESVGENVLTASRCEYLPYQWVQCDVRVEGDGTVTVSESGHTLSAEPSAVSVTVTANSQSCVTLRWTEPSQPNGVITGYRYRCSASLRDEDRYTNRTVTSERSTRSCGYSPGEYVTCQVSASTFVGFGPSGDGRGRTSCATPVLPEASSYYVTEGSYRPSGSAYHQRRLRVDIPDSDITANCDSISKRQFKLSDDYSYQWSSYYRYDLDARTTYIVTFRVTNSGGYSATRQFTVITGELEPSAVSVTVQAYSQNCVTLTWTEPSRPNGVITGYRYRCSASLLRDGDRYTNRTVTSGRSAFSCGYSPGEYVTCQVSASTSVGFGPSGERGGRIPCADPVLPLPSSSYVTEQAYFPAGSLYRRRQIRVHIPDSAITANCYYISSSESTLSTNINFRNSLYFIGNLSALTNYAVTFRATNNEGLTASRQFTVTTGELEPYGVIVTVQYLNTTCVTLMWSVPSQSNGVITAYTYRCSAGPLNSWDRYKSSPESIESCGYRQGQKVTCQVAASTSVGFGPPGESTFQIACTKPTGLSVLVEDEVSTTKNGTEFITMVMSQLAATSNCDRITYYSVTVSLNGETIDEKSLLSLVPVIFSVGDLSPYTNYSITLRARNNEGLEETTRSIYLTKETRPSDPPSVQLSFTTSCVTLQISSPEIPNGVITHYQYNCRGGGLADDFNNNWNGTEYDSYPEICKLETGSMIECNVSAFNSAGESLIAYSAGSTQLEATPGGVRQSCQEGCTAGTVVGVLLFVLIVTFILVGIIYHRRRKSKNLIAKSGGHRFTFTAVRSQTSSSSSTIAAERQHSEVSLNGEVGDAVYEEYPAEVQIYDSIPVSSLSQYTESNVELILAQFQELGDFPKPRMLEAQLPKNRGKCKYINLYPGDDHRVKLDQDERVGTDFINASYINGYKKKDAFIAAQAPLAATVEDFWLMIWQQKIKGIVMVTNLVENSKLKSVKYWPDDGRSPAKFADITVTLMSEDSNSDFTIRTMRVSKDGQTMTVKQFHYESWPDHGVPVEMSPFIIFVRKVKEFTVRLTTPVLVHCSAGVGRTGTFIALDTLVDEANDKQSVNPYDSVAEMRLRRPCMIQTKEQYQFLHKVLDEVLKTHQFVCSPMTLEDRLAVYFDKKDRQRDFIRAEFNRIEQNLRACNPSYSLGEAKENRSKNRYPDILPDMDHCVYIGGGYINAILVDDYKKRKHIIATQLPLTNTMVDFWRMIEDQEVKVIVQLQHQEDDFYPSSDEETCAIGEFLIARREVEVNDDISVFSLSITSKTRVNSIYLLLVNGWSRDHGKLKPPSTESLLSYLGELQKYQQQTQDGKICVTDMDGCTRSGLFIAAYSAVENLKAEQEVDLYNTVLKIRFRRQQFVSSLQSYVYLYTLLKEFSEAFSDYSNFKCIE